jgi:hypothetical protein
MTPRMVALTGLRVCTECQLPDRQSRDTQSLGALGVPPVPALGAPCVVITDPRATVGAADEREEVRERRDAFPGLPADVVDGEARSCISDVGVPVPGLVLIRCRRHLRTVDRPRRIGSGVIPVDRHAVPEVVRIDARLSTRSCPRCTSRTRSEQRLDANELVLALAPTCRPDSPCDGRSGVSLLQPGR